VDCGTEEEEQRAAFRRALDAMGITVKKIITPDHPDPRIAAARTQWFMYNFWPHCTSDSQTIPKSLAPTMNRADRRRAAAKGKKTTRRRPHA